MFLKRIDPPKTLAEFIVRSKKAGYLDAELISEKHLANLHFLPMGQLLRDRIAHEWNNIARNFKSTIKMYDENSESASNGTGFIDRYKEISNGMDPENVKIFGVFRTQKLKKTTLHAPLSDENQTKLEIAVGGTELVSHYVVSEKKSMEYFYNVQRQRKLWWMKYASDVGRFSLSEIREEKVRNLKVKTVWLKANYEFGSLPLECVQLMPGKCFQSASMTTKTEAMLLNKVIRTCASLDVATLETTLDCIAAADYGEMAIHRKLAPFQIAFYCLAEGNLSLELSKLFYYSNVLHQSTDDTVLADLKQLARLLQLMFEKVKISTIALDQCQYKTKFDLDTKYVQDDSIGVPYSILLEPNVLETGILKLRCRDTTLHEQVHIAHIEAYLVKIFNS